ncbi:MAG TPA: MmcQ/YjbR family DNA-binding protein [Saprospiraceae bacterium]|nr:MmcQ/YjbR family DNA-binding protein [Saprospiraceae bacterium]
MMNIEALRDYCLSKAGATEDLPFGEDTLAFRVASKIFALTNLNDDRARVNLKCDPKLALELREKYPGDIIPGYHMNKKHWNTVYLDGAVSDSYLIHLVNHSYELVVAGLPPKLRNQYNPS